MKFIATFADDSTAIIQTANWPLCTFEEIEIAISRSSKAFISAEYKWNRLQSVLPLHAIVDLADGYSFNLISVDNPVVYQLSGCYVMADYQSIFFRHASSNLNTYKKEDYDQ